MNIPIDRIVANPEQPRKHFDEDALLDLATSIKENGVIQSITVEDAGDEYILHDGERRLRAAQIAGLTEIPAHVVPQFNGTGKRDRLVRALVANVQRQDLDPIEEARAYLKMRDELDMSVEEIGRTIGVGRHRIDQRLKLLDLDPEIQDLVADGRLYRDYRLAEALCEIPEREARIKTARHIAKNSLKLKSGIKAAKRIASAVKELQVEVREDRSRPYAVRLAASKAKSEAPTPRWNALVQVKQAPPWKTVVEQVESTCSVCALRSMAGPETCGPCPLVVFLRGLMEVAA